MPEAGDKNIDYGAISDLVKKKVKLLVLIGEAKEKIRSALGGIVPIKEALTLDEAVNLSYAQAKGGDCVLFLRCAPASICLKTTNTGKGV